MGEGSRACRAGASLSEPRKAVRRWALGPISRPITSQKSGKNNNMQTLPTVVNVTGSRPLAEHALPSSTMSETRQSVSSPADGYPPPPHWPHEARQHNCPLADSIPEMSPGLAHTSGGARIQEVSGASWVNSTSPLSQEKQAVGITRISLFGVQRKIGG